MLLQKPGNNNQFRRKSCSDGFKTRRYTISTMKNTITIYFEQSGGFMGMTISLVLKEEMLSKDESEHVHILIEQADFFELQTDTAGQGMPDQLLYRISVETSKQKHTISIYEQQVTAELKPLIKFLSRKARTVKKR